MREQGQHRRRGGTVFVLADGVQHLAFALLDFLQRKRRLHHHVADQLEHRLEIFRQTRAAHRHHVTVRANAQRHPSFVERLGDVFAAPALCAPVEHPRSEMAQPKQCICVVNASRTHGHLERDGRHGVRFFRDDDGAVVQRVSGCRQTFLKSCRHSSSSAGRVEPADSPLIGSEIRLRRVIHFGLCHGGNAGGRLLVDVEAGNGLKVSELMSEIRHAVVFEHQTGAQLVFGLRQLALGDAVPAPHRRALRGSRLDVLQTDALHGRGGNQIQKRVLGRQQSGADVRREPASRPARDTAARFAAAAPCENSTTG